MAALVPLDTENMSQNGTTPISNSTTVVSDYGVKFLRPVDIVILIACIGFCAVFTMLVIGQRKRTHGYEHPGNWMENVPQLPVFLRWVRTDSEL